MIFPVIQGQLAECFFLDSGILLSPLAIFMINLQPCGELFTGMILIQTPEGML